MFALLDVKPATTEIEIENAEVLANEIYEIARIRRDLEKRESKIKTFFKSIIGTDGFIRVGSFVLTLKDGQTTYLDREKMIEDMGEAFMKKYTLTTEYKRFDIIKDKADFSIVKK